LPIQSEFHKNLQEQNKKKSIRNDTVIDLDDDSTPTTEIDVFQLCGNLYFVFEFIDHDLGGLIDSQYQFSIQELKCIMKQLLDVLDYLYELRIIHRDIKSSNILISNHHQIKLADFGLARSLQSSENDLSNNVITLWYRPPELLLGAIHYNTSVDVWSMGCVLGELELGKPLFPGKTEIEQMDYIFRFFGRPTEEHWHGVSTYPQYITMLEKISNQYTNNQFASYYQNKLSAMTINLLERMLVLDPNKRSTPKVLLTNPYFHTQPLPPENPMELEPLKIPPGIFYHEYRTKLTRKQQLQQLQQQLQQKNQTKAIETTTNESIRSSETSSTSGISSLPSTVTKQPPHLQSDEQPKPPPPTVSSSTTTNSVTKPFPSMVTTTAANLQFKPPQLLPRHHHHHQQQQQQQQESTNKSTNSKII
jgi:cyclin-dependent kinase 12/13